MWISGLNRLLLIITVKGALSTFSAKSILPQSKKKLQSHVKEAMFEDSVKFKLCFASETNLYFMLKGHSLTIILNSNFMYKEALFINSAKRVSC